jgi:hypothetical protein
VAFARPFLIFLKRCFCIGLVFLLAPSGARAGCGDDVVVKSRPDAEQSFHGNDQPGGLPKPPCGAQCSRNSRPLLPLVEESPHNLLDPFLTRDGSVLPIVVGEFFRFLPSCLRVQASSEGLYRPPRSLCLARYLGA